MAKAILVVNYNRSMDAAQRSPPPEAHGVAALAVQVTTISDLAAVQHMAEVTLDRFGGVDIIVNSASDFGQISVPTDDYETWQRDAHLHRRHLYVTNNLAPSMLARGGGAIVNVIDLSAGSHWRRFTAHAVGRAGMMALARQFAVELAPAIRVNALASGPVLPPDNHPQERVERAANLTLLKRWGQPVDATVPCAIDRRRNFVTGSILVVDGGEQLV